MKTIILSVLIAFCTLTYGQKLLVTPNGLKDSSDNEKTYTANNSGLAKVADQF